MKCPNCGTELTEGVTFCTSCGTKVGESNQQINKIKCSNCGTELSNNEAFCTNCETKVGETNQTPSNQVIQPTTQSNDKTKLNKMGLIGFIISLVSIWLATIILGPVAAILSALAIKQIQSTGEKGKGFAIAGLVISIAGLVLLVIFRATGIM